MTVPEDTTYRQQIEAGKKIAREILENLATDLKQEQINNFSFVVTHKDFDLHQVSILNDQGKMVTKVEDKDLADAPVTPSVRRRLEDQLSKAVAAYYKL